ELGGKTDERELRRKIWATSGRKESRTDGREAMSVDCESARLNCWLECMGGAIQHRGHREHTEGTELFSVCSVALCVLCVNASQASSSSTRCRPCGARLRKIKPMPPASSTIMTMVLKRLVC